MSDAILVTGAGGFVGSAVVRHLARRLDRGPLAIGGEHEARRVVALLRPGGSLARLEELEPSSCWSVVEADLAQAVALRQLLAAVRPVAIVHTALDAAAFVADTDSAREALVATPLIALLAGLAACGGRRFVHTGSAWVLPGGTDLDEAAPPQPASPYARAKHLEDRLLPDQALAAGVEWINLRLFNLFGRYERADRLIPYLVARLSRAEPADLSAAENVRDFTDISLAARAYELALEVPAANDLYHIGTGRGTAIAEVATLVAQAVGGAELLRFGRRHTPDLGMSAQVASVARARARLGWDPPDDLDVRIRNTAHWWWQRLEPTADPSATRGV